MSGSRLPRCLPHLIEDCVKCLAEAEAVVDAYRPGWECRRAVFRFTLDEWHRGQSVTIGHPHWAGYEPISVLAERPADDGMVDVTVWFRRAK